MLRNLASLTSPRGWAIVLLIAVGAYLVLGIPGLVAWLLGALAGLSVSGEWEEEGTEPDDCTPVRSEPAVRTQSTSAAGSWWQRIFESDSHLQFALLRHRRVRTAGQLYFR